MTCLLLARVRVLWLSRLKRKLQAEAPDRLPAGRLLVTPNHAPTIRPASAVSASMGDGLRQSTKPLGFGVLIGAFVLTSLRLAAAIARPKSVKTLL